MPRWDEIKASTWTVPAERMKGRLEDRVPLSDSAVAVLEQQARVRANEFVFPGARRRSLHDRAMQALLHRMDVPYSVHGMRSSFRDWSVEVSDAPDWVSEKALAHLVGDETRRAYQRGDLFEKRKELMTTAWAAFCDGPNQCKLRQSEPPSPKSLLKTVACKSFLLDVRQLGGAL